MAVNAANILVVDDEPACVEILQRALGERGHVLRGAESAEAAAEVLAREPFDLVLLDHVLPGKTGMQALRDLRPLTKAPIHLMTGYSDDDTRADALLLGADGFLPKPLDLAEVAAIVAALPERST